MLGVLGIKAEAQVSQDQENEAYLVEINSNEAGVLIGHHGETISAFQLLLGQIVNQKTGEWARILVNVGDWRQRREETLRALAQTLAAKTKETGEPQHIYDLTPAERRIVHIALAEDPEVTTESEGEGRDRHIVIKPKS